MALYIMNHAYTQGLIKPDDIIAEATSGNTGVAFSAIGRVLGRQVMIMMLNWLSKERQDIIRSFGATVRLVSREEGGFLGSIRLAEEFNIH